MDRESLKAWIEAGLSLSEIGELVGRDPSTVGYWVKKHGLSANGAKKHAPRGGIDRRVLQELVSQGLPLREIAERTDRSMSTVRYWIDRYDLERPLAVRRSPVDRALAKGRRTLDSDCSKHGRTTFVIENSGRKRCRRCRMEAVTSWRRRAKAKLVAEAGGRCSICGYDRHQAALQFHHRDPATKSFHLAESGVTRSIEALRAEVEKCVLLCANCHAEVEVGFTRI